MFNSSLQYCAKCKQYVALDQSKEQCAANHACDVRECGLKDLFRSPSPTAEGTDPKAGPEPTGSP